MPCAWSTPANTSSASGSRPSCGGSGSPPGTTAQAFAARLVERLAAKDVEFVRAAIDPHAMCDRGFAGLDVAEQTLRDFRWGFVKSFDLAKELVAADARPQLLRVEAEQAGARATLRFATEDGDRDCAMLIGRRLGRLGVLDWQVPGHSEPISALIADKVVLVSGSTPPNQGSAPGTRR